MELRPGRTYEWGSYSADVVARALQCRLFFDCVRVKALLDASTFSNIFGALVTLVFDDQEAACRRYYASRLENDSDDPLELTHTACLDVAMCISAGKPLGREEVMKSMELSMVMGTFGIVLGTIGSHDQHVEAATVFNMLWQSEG
jgi:hypothetical protein